MYLFIAIFFPAAGAAVGAMGGMTLAMLLNEYLGDPELRAWDQGVLGLQVGIAVGALLGIWYAYLLIRALRVQEALDKSASE